jgi:hypothetical protein
MERYRHRGHMVLTMSLAYLGAFAIFKDEASYLPEWFEFHRLVGVERFFLYDNGSSDGVSSEVPEVSSCDLQRSDTRQDHDQDAGRRRSALRTPSGVAL